MESLDNVRSVSAVVLLFGLARDLIESEGEVEKGTEEREGS